MNITFTYEAWEKINTYIKLSNIEISGLGISSLSEDKKTIIIRDIKIWEQECTGATTEIMDNKHLIDCVEEYKKEGVPMEDMNVWWHSHVNMTASFSHTDDTTMEQWFNEKYLVAIVGNKKKEFEANIIVNSPFKYKIEEDIDITYESSPTNKKLEEQIEKEIKEKVTKPETIVINKWTGQKSEFDNGHDAYQIATNHLNKKDKEDFLKTCAQVCDCKECKDFLDNKRKKFPFKTHIYDAYEQVWKTIEDYNDSIMKKDDPFDDWEEEMRWQTKNYNNRQNKLPMGMQ